MNQVFERFSAKAQSIFARARSGDTVVIGGAVLLGAAIFGLYELSRDAHCARHLTDDQRAFLEPTEVSVRGAKVTVRPVTVRTIKNAAASMAAAYSTDPLVTACEQENMSAAAKRRAETWAATMLLRAVLPAKSGSICLTTENNEAVAIWRTRGAEVDRWSLLFAGGWQYIFRLSGWSRRGRFPGYSRVVTANRQRLMEKHGSEFFYLLSATVRPDVIDQTLYLSAVVQPVCDRADAQGLPCFVEVTRSDLVPVYAALGFDALEQCDPFGVTVFLMKRLPRQRLGVASAGKNTL